MNIQNALRGRHNNFTLLRLLAAFAVLYGHSYDLSLGRPGADPVTQNVIYHYWLNSLPGLAVALFFVSSGFLVCGSYLQRDDLAAFGKARFLRIFPGLLVSVLFCIFIVGGLTTKLAPGHYFPAPSTWNYFATNVTLLDPIQYGLPGVFEDNPIPSSVNGSIWTLEIELKMYVLTALAGALSILKRRMLFNVLCAAVLLGYAIHSKGAFILMPPNANWHLGAHFFLGMLLYVNRDRVPLNIPFAITFCILSLLIRGLPFSFLLQYVSFAYLVLVLALHPRLRLPSIDRFGDISYGLYIYAFPVQQSIAHLYPGVSPLKMLLSATLVTTALAILSWRWIEEPALRRKAPTPVAASY